MVRTILGRLAAIALLAFSLGAVERTYAQEIMIPNFWDKNERFAKPDFSRTPRLRFLTTTDFPPFNFVDRKKRLSGFHVDLAREICIELGVLNRCEIQALPWDDLKEALEKGEGEAILAGHSINPETRKEFSFSRSYIRIPGRFVTHNASGLTVPVYDSLFRKKTGLVAGSSHQAYFEKVFPNRQSTVFPSRQAALDALKKKEVDAVFSDAVSLSFWITSAASEDCCSFVDGPFESEEFFGNGMAVTLLKGDQKMMDAMNFALSRINEKGTFAELYLRYFPVGLF